MIRNRLIIFLSVCAITGGKIFAEEAKPTAESNSPAQVATPATPPASSPVATPAPTQVSEQKTQPAGEKADYIGAAVCLSCHADKKEFEGSHHARNMSRAKGIEFEKTCETCHGPGSLHAAAAGDKANPGYASIRTFSGASKTEASATCLQCHADQTRLHWQGGVHDQRGLSCLSCHSMHKPMAEHNQLIKATEADTCYQCHKDVKAQMRRSSHMPVADGKMTCSSCHNPHGSATDKLLVADSVTDLCFKCHQDKRGPNLWEHPPVRENCLTCHAPHGSHNDKMLVAKMPLLCQRCHIQSQHRSDIYGGTSINNQDNRIFGHSCVSCHSNIHGSNHPSGKFFTR